MPRRLQTWILVFALCSLPIPQSCLASVVLQTGSGNLVSRHLAGEWRLADSLSRLLTGSGGGAPSQVSIQEDPSVLTALSPKIEEALAGNPVFIAGTLRFEASRFGFLLTEKAGSPVLICFRQGQQRANARPTLVLLALVPAKDSANDLLFLGGETDVEPFFAYERAERQANLSPETERLLNTALSKTYSKELTEALTELPKRSDWQGVVDTLLAAVRRKPTALHNNSLIVLQEIVGAHLQEARVDLDPLIATLGSEEWTNQQKAALLLAKMTEQVSLFKGKEQPVIRALIPLTASQRGPVVEPALLALHRLTDQSNLQRDPEAWARWFEATYHEPVKLVGAVYEMVNVIGIEGREGNSRRYRLSGHLYRLAELRDHLQTAVNKARLAGLRPSFVLLVSVPTTTAETQAAGLAEAEPVRAILDSLGFQDLTLAPKDTRFYRPFRPGYPMPK